MAGVCRLKVGSAWVWIGLESGRLKVGSDCLGVRSVRIGLGLGRLGLGRLRVGSAWSGLLGVDRLEMGWLKVGSGRLGVGSAWGRVA